MPADDSGDPSRLDRWLPGLAVLRHYDRSWLRGDVLAGVTVAAYLVPQVMAYAEVAGLPPVTGLWAVIGPLLVYAVVGSSRQLSVGPESTTALMAAVSIAAIGGTPADAAAVLAIGVGLVCFAARAAKLGFLADLLSRPVLIGYLAGIAVLMVVSQLGKLTKLKIPGDSPFARVGYLLQHLSDIHLPTLALASGTVIVLFALRRWLPTWPGPLIAMLGTAALVRWLWPHAGFTVIGQIPHGIPTPRLPDLEGINLAAVLPAAIGLAVVGYSDNVLTARAFASKRDETIDADQELFALGAANIASAVGQGFPVSSSGSRAVLGDAMGSRTQLYSLVCLGVVLLTMLFLAPVLATFPAAALGAVVVYAAIRLVDLPEFRRLAHFRRTELWLALVTAAGVVVWDVLIGIGVAVALSLIDLLRRLFKPHDAVLGYVPGVAGMHDVDDFPRTDQIAGLLVYRYDAPLFFANSENLVNRALDAVRQEQRIWPVHWFVLNAEANVEVDLTAVDALERLRSTLEAEGIVFALARVKQEVADQLQRAGFLDKVGGDRVFATLPTAVAAYGDWAEAHLGARPALPVLGPGMVWRDPGSSHQGTPPAT